MKLKSEFFFYLINKMGFRNGESTFIQIKASPQLWTENVIKRKTPNYMTTAKTEAKVKMKFDHKYIITNILIFVIIPFLFDCCVP